MIVKKDNSKDKRMSVLVLIGGAILMLAVGFTINEMTNKLFINYDKIEIESSDVCDEPKLYYEGEDFNIYTYCLNSIKLAGDSDRVELKDFFQTDFTLDNLYDRLEKQEVYKDGGSTMYRAKKADISVLRCNTLEGNKDVYIGRGNMQYEENFCKSSYSIINEKNFDVSFDVLLVSLDNDEAYKYLTLSIVNVGQVETVRVKSEDIKNIKKMGAYKISFEAENVPFKGDIKSIFENSKIVAIKKED